VIAAIAIVAIALFGGANNYKVHVVFQSAGQLVKGNQVRVSGSPVGTITDIQLNDEGQAVVTLKVDDNIAPLHAGTTAVIRATSLSGIANRYVSIQPGPNNGQEIADGGTITADSTSAPVDLDQLFNTLDPKTRQGLRNLIRGQADWYDGRAPEAAESTKYVAPFLVSTTDLTREIGLDEVTFRKFLTDSARTVSAIAERRDDLANLVSNTNTAMAAIGDENVALSQTLELLPGTLRKANTTFVNLRSALDDLDVLVNVSKPATKDLAPFFKALRPVVHEARPTISDLSELIRKPGPNNDLIELTAKQPQLARLTASVFPRTIRTLDRSQPVFEYVRPFTPDFAAWFTKFAEVAGYYDANGHYARVQPVFAPAAYSQSTGQLTVVNPNDKLATFEQGVFNRCPGTATQPAGDGSQPFVTGGCDPNAILPGP
jgi:phospholipid/cholesterol/gamma-HCH transport system substrate-binding protein